MSIQLRGCLCSTRATGTEGSASDISLSGCGGIEKVVSGGVVSGEISFIE